ncbi:MAG: L,D-transpeptidase family protein [Candidatus Omnitrophica bacterium]|nr:L,D-transpeptidase family protein [Candidatus Omnitrophota bacterium]MDE2214119.1 L,D-transpeptidase family protein [Candidatus Omnitrophota bacterium]MDE2231156.1 L,D-transpeptidase family protein [Candidatus Omnitrophota bacterium]
MVLCFCLPALQGCTALTPPSLFKLGPSISQAVIVHPVAKNSIHAGLSAWQKTHAGQGAGNGGWRRIFFVRALIGKNGLADPGRKKEGDGKTPWGVYPLGPAFGYAPSAVTGLPYRQATDIDFWVDDPRSMQYNQWVRGTPRAHSFERLKRPDDLYRYGVVIGYNMHPVIPGAGSAIFMHIWRGGDSPTAGCVALSQRNLRRILRWLNQRDQPVIILE